MKNKMQLKYLLCFVVLSMFCSVGSYSQSEEEVPKNNDDNVVTSTNCWDSTSDKCEFYWALLEVPLGTVKRTIHTSVRVEKNNKDSEDKTKVEPFDKMVTNMDSETLDDLVQAYNEKVESEGESEEGSPGDEESDGESEEGSPGDEESDGESVEAPKDTDTGDGVVDVPWPDRIVTADGIMDEATGVEEASMAVWYFYLYLESILGPALEGKYGDIEFGDCKTCYPIDPCLIETCPENHYLSGSGSSCNCVERPKRTYYLDNDRDGYHIDEGLFYDMPEGRWSHTTYGEDCDDTNAMVKKNNKCGKCELEPLVDCKEGCETKYGLAWTGNFPPDVQVGLTHIPTEDNFRNENGTFTDVNCGTGKIDMGSQVKILDLTPVNVKRQTGIDTNGDPIFAATTSSYFRIQYEDCDDKCDVPEDDDQEYDFYLDGDEDGYHSNQVKANKKPEGKWITETKGEDCDDTNPHKTKLVNGVCLDECDLAKAAKAVYNTANNYKEHNVFDTSLQNGWNLSRQDELPFAGTNFKFSHANSGFNSALYVREENGVKQYLYVTEGTDPTQASDVVTDVDQLFRSTAQYEVSVQNARILHDLISQESNSVLFFTGHSLGGGLASANALATGDYAFTYNAAGLSSSTISQLNLNSGFESNIDATIVEGEILNAIQTRLGIEALGNTNYIDGEDVTNIKFYDALTKEYQEKYEQALSDLNIKEAYGFGKEYIKNKKEWLYSKVKAHEMDTVLKALNCPE